MEVPEKEHLKRAWRKECLPHVVQNVIIGGLLWGLGSTIIVLLVTKKTFLAKYLRTSQKALFISMATVGGVIVSGERTIEFVCTLLRQQLNAVMIVLSKK